MKKDTKVKEKNKAAVALGRLGGLARSKSISKERLKEIASFAAKKRWADQLKLDNQDLAQKQTDTKPNPIQDEVPEIPDTK